MEIRMVKLAQYTCDVYFYAGSSQETVVRIPFTQDDLRLLNEALDRNDAWFKWAGDFINLKNISHIQIEPRQ